MCENILYEINGTKYLLVELIISSEKTSDRINNAISKYDCIHQGIKEANRGGLFSNAYIIQKILVPEHNIEKFNSET